MGKSGSSAENRGWEWRAEVSDTPLHQSMPSPTIMCDFSFLTLGTAIAQWSAPLAPSAVGYLRVETSSYRPPEAIIWCPEDPCMDP